MEPADLDIADLDQALLLIPSEAAKEIRAFCASLEKLQPDQRIKRCEQKRDNLLTCYAELEASLICYQLVFERYLCPGNSWPQFGAVVQAREISKRLKSLIGVSKIWGRNVVTHYGFVSQSRGYCDELRAFAKMVPVWEKAVAILNRSIYQRTNRTDKRTPAVKEAVNPIERWDLQYSKRYIGTANRQERAIPSVPLRYGLDQYGLIVFESFASRPPLVSSLSPHAPGHHTTPESDDCSIQPPSPSKPASIASGITAHTLSLPASAQSSPTKSTGIMNTINATGEDTTIPLELLTTISRSLSNGSSPLSSMPSNSPASSVSTSTCGQQPSTGADNGHLKRKRVPSQIDDHTSSKRGCEDNMLMDDAGNHRNCVVTSLAMTHSVPFRSAVPFPAQSVTNTSTSTANEKLLPPKWRRANLSKEDIRTLDNDNWLNDNVIMFYLHFLHTSTAQMSVHHIYIQESYFFAKLKTESSKPFRYKTMATWTKGDIFSYEYIVVPICEKSHWYMAIIYQPGKLLAQETMDLETKIITLDSLGKAHPQTCSILQEYLIYERERRLRSCGQKASGLLGSLCITADVPRQDNHNDCGIFLLEYFRIFLSDPGEFIVKILSKEAMHWPIRPMKLRKDICDVIMNLQPELRSRIGRTNGESPRAITEDSFDLDVERDLGAQLADYAIAAGSPEARLLTAFSKLPSEDVMIIKQIDLQMLVTVLHVALKRVYHSQLLQVPPEQAGLVSAEASGTDLVSFQKRTEDKTNRESSDTMAKHCGDRLSRSMPHSPIEEDTAPNTASNIYQEHAPIWALSPGQPSLGKPSQDLRFSTSDSRKAGCAVEATPTNSMNKAIGMPSPPRKSSPIPPLALDQVSEVVDVAMIGACGHNLQIHHCGLQVSPNPLSTVCTHETEWRLYEYYIEKFCPTRTLYSESRHNSYIQALPSNPSRPVMAAIFCLVSLYLHRDETPYFVTAIAFLKEAVRGDSEISDLVRILRLLVQYHTVKRHLDQNWVFHIRGLGALQRRIPVHSETMSLCVPIVYESIMKFSAHDDGFPNDGLSIDFLLHLENPQLIRDFGCSLELLHLLGTINIEVCRTMEDPLRRKHTAQSLFAKCDSIMQTSLESDRRDPVESTAESYVKMARVIICWRFCFPSPELDALGDDLAHCVRRIPTEGSWFTAQYPLAPAFWASIFSPRIGDQCLHILRSVWTDRPTNITHAIRVAEGVIARPSGTVIDMDLFKKIMTSMQMGALSLG